jgi:hypothetical protein
MSREANVVGGCGQSRNIRGLSPRGDQTAQACAIGMIDGSASLPVALGRSKSHARSACMLEIRDVGRHGTGVP